MSRTELHRFLPPGEEPRGTSPWELTVRSRRLRLGYALLALVVFAAHVGIAAALPVEKLPDAVGFADQISFVILGAAIAAVCAMPIRARVRVSADGVEIRNMFAARFFPWSIVHGLSFPRGNRCARLELPEDEYAAMWAFQAADGAAALEAVKAFRALEERYMPLDD